VANSTFLSSQLDGAVVQAVILGLQNAIQEPLSLINYWSTLSILTAQDADGTLNYVGALSGYPRPLVSDVFFSTYILILTDAALWDPSFITTNYGLSDASLWPSGPGGELDTAIPATTNTMPASWYQQLIPVFATARLKGLTISAVDALAAWANTNGGGTGYTLKWDANDNVAVIFTTYIDPRNLSVVNMIAAALETLPLVVFEEP
jgi:hypothetical protein